MAVLLTYLKRAVNRNTFGRWVHWGQKGGLAILDQGLFAGANFLVKILLARWLGPEQYGSFAAAFSLFLLLGAFHTALLTEPMLVFGPGKYAERFRDYFGILIRGHTALTIAVSFVLAIMATTMWRLGSAAMASGLLGLAIASPFTLFLWLVRRAFYVRFRPQWAAAGSALYLLLMLLGMYGLFRTHRVSSFSALIVMGIAGMIVGLGLLYSLHPRLRIQRIGPKPNGVLSDHWGYGKWAATTVIFMWMPGNIYFVVLPVWAGLEAAAGFQAILNFLMPVWHTLTALSVLLVPVFVRMLRFKSRSEFHSLLRLILFLLTMGSILYACLLILFRTQAMAWLYAGQYSEYTGLLILAAPLSVVASVEVLLQAIFRAEERPKKIFQAQVASSLIALTLGLYLAATSGVAGALLGLLVSSGSALTVLAYSYFRQDRQLRFESTDA